MSDTPRTDAEILQNVIVPSGSPVVWASVARQLERELAAAQAKIDALMLEHCPDEMTPEQVANWGKHQRRSAA